MSPCLLWDLVARTYHLTHAPRFVHPTESRNALLARRKCALDHSFKLVRALASVQLPQAELQPNDCVPELMHVVPALGHGSAPVVAKRWLRLREHDSSCVGSMAVSPAFTREYYLVYARTRIENNPDKLLSSNSFEETNQSIQNVYVH